MFSKRILSRLIIFCFLTYSYFGLACMVGSQQGIMELSKDFFTDFPEFCCGTDFCPVDLSVEDMSQPIVPVEDLSELLKEFIRKAGDEKKNHDILDTANFMQKLEVMDGDEVYITGDLHGSAHSLFRNFIRLINIGVLNDDFSLNETDSGGRRYFLFTGDYADRGRYGVEVWYLLLRLKLANWDKVFLCRGNHEYKHMAGMFGFFDEIKIKYGQDYEKLIPSMEKAFDSLVSAVFIGSEKDFIQVSHGSLPLDTSGDVITSFYEGFLSDTSRTFSSVSDYPARYIHCGDFSNEGDDRGLDKRGGNMRIITAERAKTSLSETRVRNIFRGHQHCSHAVTIEPWQIIKKKGNYLEHSEAISVSKNFVYTFMSCPEGAGFLNIFDGFGLLKIKENYDNWTLECFEYPVDKGNRVLVPYDTAKKLCGYIWKRKKLNNCFSCKFVSHDEGGGFSWYVPASH